MRAQRYALIGGGILGTAVARRLLQERPSIDVTLLDDFRIDRRGAVVAIRNAPSLAATSALAIAEHIVEGVLDDTTPEP